MADQRRWTRGAAAALHPAPSPALQAKERQLEELQQQAEQLAKRIDDLETEIDNERPPDRQAPYILLNGTHELALEWNHWTPGWRAKSSHPNLPGLLLETTVEVEVQLDPYDRPSRGTMQFNEQTMKLEGNLEPALEVQSIHVRRCKCGHFGVTLCY